MATPLEILQQYWHYDSFRPKQEEAIQSIMQGRDTLLMLPTGGGKSICFQVPALAQEGICVVVSPLVALMSDQVSQLRKRHIPATFITAALRDHEIEVILNQCVFGQIKILYVSPERFQSRLFIDHFRQMRLSLVAIDEAHCISQWGHDFRRSYLNLHLIRDLHPQVPLMALTASATPKVVDDICRLLHTRHVNIIQSTFFRSNLAYMVLPEEDKRGRLLRIVRHVGGCGIVYVRRRSDTQDIARFLQSHGITAEYYHAGLNAKERATRQQAWMQSSQCVMVATSAFGMGIDKPDVRFVVHLHIPASMEEYYQEAGRAGRDGKSSYAVLLHDAHDKDSLHHHLAQSFPPLPYIRNVYQALCNHYHIPIGGGEGLRQDFDAAEFCRSYGLEIVPFFAAARFLEREELLSLPDTPQAISQLFIPISKQDLYRFQVESSRYGDLLQTIIRLYGGLFTTFVNIYEREIARICHTSEQAVQDALSLLDKQKIVFYNKKSDKPQILFLSPRIPADNLHLSPENYQQVKDSAYQRANQMLHFVETTNQCRSQQLCAHFGESQSPLCGQCDICRQAPQADLPARIEQLLRAQPLTTQQLAQALNTPFDDTFVHHIQTLLDQEKLHLSPTLQLVWTE